MPGKPWLTTEVAVLREHYPLRGARGCATLLPGRSLEAISMAAFGNGVRIAHRRRNGAACDAVLRALDDAGSSLGEIAARAGLRPDATCRTLRALVARGEAERLAQGVYRRCLRG